MLSKIAKSFHAILSSLQRLRNLILIALTVFVLFNLAATVVYGYGLTDRAAPSDVIVILGAGVHADGSPTQAQMRRVAHAILLYRQGLAPYLICTGGVDRPSDPKSEAETCVEMLKLAGVPDSAILREDISTSTEENAIEAGKVMADHSLKTAILVSDGFHLLRSTILFQIYHISVTNSPAQSSMGQIDWKRALEGTYREVLALGWLAGKTILHLPFTNFPKRELTS